MPESQVAFCLTALEAIAKKNGNASHPHLQAHRRCVTKRHRGMVDERSAREASEAGLCDIPH